MSSPSPTIQPSAGPDFAGAVSAITLKRLQTEFETTCKVIAAIPEAKQDYRPDPKAKTAIELARHIAASEIWFLNGIADGKFDADSDETKLGLDTPVKVLEYFKREFPKGVDRVKQLPANRLAEVVDFFGMKQPAFTYLDFQLVHTVHHRGALATYLRPMGSKIPSIYGGSADEPFTGSM
jgi:uncharacterized damage-inducible protein DinB